MRPQADRQTDHRQAGRWIDTDTKKLRNKPPQKTRYRQTQRGGRPCGSGKSLCRLCLLWVRTAWGHPPCRALTDVQVWSEERREMRKSRGMHGAQVGVRRITEANNGG